MSFPAAPPSPCVRRGGGHHADGGGGGRGREDGRGEGGRTRARTRTRTGGGGLLAPAPAGGAGGRRRLGPGETGQEGRKNIPAGNRRLQTVSPLFFHAQFRFLSFVQSRCDRGTQTSKDPLAHETETLAFDVVFSLCGRAPPAAGRWRSAKGGGGVSGGMGGVLGGGGEVAQCLRRTVAKMLEKHSLVFNSMVARIRVDGHEDMPRGFGDLCDELFFQGEVGCAGMKKVRDSSVQCGLLLSGFVVQSRRPVRVRRPPWPPLSGAGHGRVDGGGGGAEFVQVRRRQTHPVPQAAGRMGKGLRDHKKRTQKY